MLIIDSVIIKMNNLVLYQTTAVREIKQVYYSAYP